MRGQCRYSKCACTKYMPLVGRPKPANGVIGRLLYKRRISDARAKRRITKTDNPAFLSAEAGWGNNIIMDKEFELQFWVANMLLELADEQQELTRSDFQGRAEVVARKIIDLVRRDADRG